MKTKCMKTLGGTEILPQSEPHAGLVWVTAYPNDDKSRQFVTHIRINGVEGGRAAIEDFLGLKHTNGNCHGQLE